MTLVERTLDASPPGFYVEPNLSDRGTATEADVRPPGCAYCVVAAAVAVLRSLTRFAESHVDNRPSRRGRFDKKQVECFACEANLVMSTLLLSMFRPADLSRGRS